MTQAESLPPGLSNAEARGRLADIGPNVTPDTDLHPLRLVLSKFVAPVPCLPEAAIALQLVLGEYVEASIIGVLLVFNAALGLLHEGRAQATVKR
jgi:H+-transporting ATPase